MMGNLTDENLIKFPEILGRVGLGGGVKTQFSIDGVLDKVDIFLFSKTCFY